MRPGDVVADRFEIERLAGAGAMGLVFKAIDRRTNEAVALKLMGSAGLPERFMREADVLAELDHPGIVRHVAHGTSQDDAYIAMEWLEGRDLADALAKSPPAVSEALLLAQRMRRRSRSRTRAGSFTATSSRATSFSSMGASIGSSSSTSASRASDPT